MRVRVPLPPPAPAPVEAEPERCPFAGWQGGGLTLERFVDTSAPFAGATLQFAVRRAGTFALYEAPAGAEWAVSVSANGTIFGAQINVVEGAEISTWTVTIDPSAEDAEGYVLFDIAASVAGSIVAGPYALLLHAVPGGAG